MSLSVAWCNVTVYFMVSPLNGVVVVLPVETGDDAVVGAFTLRLLGVRGGPRELSCRCVFLRNRESIFKGVEVLCGARWCVGVNVMDSETIHGDEKCDARGRTLHRGVQETR